MPEYIADYNKGPSDFDTRHNWVVNVIWELPTPSVAAGAARRLAHVGDLDDAERPAAHGVRDREPLAVAVEPVARRRASARTVRATRPASGPTTPSSARPEQWFNPAAFVLQPAGTFGNTGRGDLVGPDLRTLDLSLTKNVRWEQLGSGGRVEFRVEAFNILNRANFGIPELRAFAGQADGEAPLATFGRISNTITSSRQIQLGVRVLF